MDQSNLKSMQSLPVKQLEKLKKRGSPHFQLHRTKYSQNCLYQKFQSLQKHFYRGGQNHLPSPR